MTDTVDLRFGPDGTVSLHTGVQARGQGPPPDRPAAGRRAARHRSCRRPPDPGDSDRVPAGPPSVASRSLMMAGSATALACDAVLDKGRELAARLLEAAPFDLEVSGGRFHVKGTDRGIGLLELARRADPAGSAVNAVMDALAVRGVEHLELPFTPGRIWSALRNGSSSPREPRAHGS